MSQENAVISHDSFTEVVKPENKSAHGDFEAFGQLYTTYLDRIFRYVLYQIKDTMTAEDIAEEVFLQAWKATKTSKDKAKPFSSLIYRIARNHIINARRNFHKFSNIEVNTSNESGLVFDMTKDQEELLDSIAELPENQAQVIILKFIEGFDNREIGRIIGKSEEVVRITQLRALTLLRQKIGGGKYGTGFGIS